MLDHGKAEIKNILSEKPLKKRTSAGQADVSELRQRRVMGLAFKNRVKKKQWPKCITGSTGMNESLLLALS